MSSSQTDFGNIYFKKPKEIFFPKSVEELKQIVSKLYQEEKKFVIRNTGHSVNGQTLTSEYQIDLSNLKEINFNEKELEVTCLAGDTWMDIFTKIKFPKYSIPVFPNNPGQKIQIGGTASVGGIGPYSFKYGGLWNYIKKIKLILPNGEELECSRNKNEEYFKYAVGGFGKIGIIAELTFEVIKSNKKIAILEVLNFSDKKYFQNIETALGNNSIVGISGISKGGKFFGTSPNALMIILESENLENDFYNLDSKFDKNLFRLILKEDKKEYFDFNFTYTEINKKQIFEYYPIDLNRNHIKGIHPWADFIFDFESYQAFLPILREVIQNYNLEKYILTQSFLNGKMSINIMPTYIGKYLGNDFPLVPEVVKVKDAYSYGIGFMPTIPKKEIKKTLNAISDLTKLTYQLKGKRYLYGIHNLSQDSLEKQFGKETLETWIKIKKEVDPKNLLNSHVIFQ